MFSREKIWDYEQMRSDHILPSVEGKKRHPDTGGYRFPEWAEDKEYKLPCTCNMRCKNPCNGMECGCPSCTDLYTEALERMD